MKNVFERARQKEAERNAAFASGRNRFQLVNDARDAALRGEGPKPEEKSFEREKAEARARFWRRSHPNSHVPLDQRTEQARQDYLKSREQERNQQPAQQPHVHVEPMTTATVVAIINEWRRRNPEYYDSEFNGAQFWNCISDHIERGETFSYEMLDRVYSALIEGGHIEVDPRIPRNRGQFILRSSPQPYIRKELTAHDRQELAERERRATQTEVDTARNIPLHELQKRVRAGFRDTRPRDIRGGR